MCQWIRIGLAAIVFFWLTSTCPAEERIEKIHSSPCLPAGLKLSSKTRVLAVSSYRGPSLGWRIGTGEQNAGLVQVAVNSPGRPVLLVLSAYESTVWQIGWTEGTEIAGVAVTGYHAQAVAGLPPSVPVAVNDRNRNIDCPHFAGASSRNSAEAAAIAGVKPDQLLSVHGGKAVAGDLLTPSQTIWTAGPLNQADYDQDWPAEKALLEAVRQGRLKPASALDYVQWLQAGGETAAEIKIPPGLTAGWTRRSISAYLVTDPDLEIPVPPSAPAKRTYVFFLPPGCRPPEKPASAAVYLLLENGTCVGRKCPPAFDYRYGSGY